MPFKKGQIPWNKGKKTGIIPKTAFKKGQRASISTEFKKGQPSWNKGKHIWTGGGMKKGMTGSRCAAWKGGTMKMANGYICQYVSPGNYVYQHRLVMEKYLGRKLIREELVHHIDGDKKNNHISNLQLCANEKEHRVLHK